MMNIIQENIENSRVYSTNGYEYFVYPYKGITPINSAEINYLAKIISDKISKDVDLIFTVETDGIFTALPVAMNLNKPLVVARSFDYKMPNPFHFTQKTGYHERELYFYFDPRKIKRVAIIECILSTGGTIKAVIDLLEKMNIEVGGIYTVINKINYSDVELMDNIKHKLFSLFDVKIENGKVIVGKSKYYR